MGYLVTSSKPFDFGADPDHDPDPGIFELNFYHLGGDAVSECFDFPYSVNNFNGAPLTKEGRLYSSIYSVKPSLFQRVSI